MDSNPIDLTELIAKDPSTATRAEAEAMIQGWRKKSAERLAADKAAEKLKAVETAMKSWLIDVFLKQKFEGIVIDGRITGLNPHDVHNITDRGKFIQYIYDKGAIDLLQFRISDAAIFLREDLGETVPGTEKVEVYNLFDRKA